MLTGAPRLVRAEIAKHVHKITLTPEGRTYVNSGTWDLFGRMAVRMVPGARLVHSSPRDAIRSRRRGITEISTLGRF